VREDGKYSDHDPFVWKFRARLNISALCAFAVYALVATALDLAFDGTAHSTLQTLSIDGGRVALGALCAYRAFALWRETIGSVASER